MLIEQYYKLHTFFYKKIEVNKFFHSMISDEIFLSKIVVYPHSDLQTPKQLLMISSLVHSPYHVYNVHIISNHCTVRKFENFSTPQIFRT